MSYLSLSITILAVSFLTHFDPLFLKGSISVLINCLCKYFGGPLLCLRVVTGCPDPETLHNVNLGKRYLLDFSWAFYKQTVHYILCIRQAAYNVFKEYTPTPSVDVVNAYQGITPVE